MLLVGNNVFFIFLNGWSKWLNLLEIFLNGWSSRSKQYVAEGGVKHRRLLYRINQLLKQFIA